MDVRTWAYILSRSSRGRRKRGFEGPAGACEGVDGSSGVLVMMVSVSVSVLDFDGRGFN